MTWLENVLENNKCDSSTNAWFVVKGSKVTLTAFNDIIEDQSGESIQERLLSALLIKFFVKAINKDWTQKLESTNLETQSTDIH